MKRFHRQEEDMVLRNTAPQEEVLMTMSPEAEEDLVDQKEDE